MKSEINLIFSLYSVYLLLAFGVWSFGCRSSDRLDELNLNSPGRLELGKPTVAPPRSHWHFYSWMRGDGELQPQWTEQFHAHSASWGPCVDKWVKQFADREEFQFEAYWRSNASGGLRAFDVSRMDPFHEKTALCLRRVLASYPLPPSNKGEIGLRTWGEGLRQMPYQVDAPKSKTRVFQ